jgi:hypothetical protein
MSKTTNNQARGSKLGKRTVRSRSQSRSGKPWSGADIMRLTVMADHQVPAARIARKLRRTESAVRAEAARHRVMLAPPSKQRQLSLTEKPAYGGLKVEARKAPASEPARSLANRDEPPKFQSETLF